MGLLLPEPGLIIWMTIAFVIVLLLLAKIAFPMIIKALDERKEYISSSLEAAGQAKAQLDNLKEEMDNVRKEADQQRAEILRLAADTREKILTEARTRAEEESARIITAAKQTAENERDAILRDAMSQVAALSIAVSEKILRSRLEDESSQTALAEKLLQGVDFKNEQKKN